MDVRGSVEISRSPSLEKQHQAERSEDSAREKKKYLLEKVMLAAVIIYAFLTLLIYLASKKAADAAKSAADTAARQLREFEDVQSARLVIEDFAPEISLQQPRDYVVVKGNFTITNIGQTEAREIYDAISDWSSYKPPNRESFSNLKPIPISNGPSLRAGQPRDYPIGRGVGYLKEMQERKTFAGFIVAFSYRDIFGNPKIVSDCFMYVPRTNRFDRCPVNMQEGGFPSMDKPPEK